MGKSFKLRNGLLLLSTEAPGGVYNAAQLKKIAALCEGDSAIAKATEDQRLALFAAPEKAAHVAKELRAVGLGVRHYQDGLHQPVNCIGELCSEHHQDAMGTSMDLARSLSTLVLSAAPLKIGINGCGRCCVPTHTLDISIVGEEKGYRVSLGGKNSQIPELATFIADGIPAQELPDLITRVVALYKMLANPGESLQAVIERCGLKPFAEVLAPYSQDGYNSQDLDEGSDIPLDDGLASDLAPEGDALDPSGEASPPEMASPSDEDLMGSAPAFDPSDEGLSAEAGPTIDSAELRGDDLGPDFFGVEHELLGDNMMDDGPMALINEPLDQSASVRGQPQGTSSKANASPLADLSEDGPIPPVEEGFDAQAVLAEDGDDLGQQEGFEPSGAPEDDLQQADLDQLAGLDADAKKGTDGPKDAAPAPTPFAPTTGANRSSPQGASGPQGALESSDGMDEAQELTEADAELLEAKLTASIAEEEKFPPIEDENATERDEVLRMMESDSPPPEMEGSEDGPPPEEAFEDLQIDEAYAPDPALDHRRVEGDSAFGDHAPEISHEDEESLSLVDEVDEVPAPVPPVPQPILPPKESPSPTPIASGARSSSPAGSEARGRKSGFALSGIDLTGEGRLSLMFESGANLVVDPRTIAPGATREFNFGGQKINITAADTGLNVEIDGVTIFLPLAA